MVTEIPRPTTLSQYKAALERAEASLKTQTQQLETTRKANTQLSTDLQTARLSVTSAQQKLAALQQSSEAELAKLRKDVAALEKQLREAQAQAAQAQADKDAAEAQASQKLTQATELLNRLKLAAVAAADREVKLNSEIVALRKQLEQTSAAHPIDTGTDEELKRLRKQIDGLVAENRDMAKVCDQLTQDQQALTTTIEGQKQAQAQAVEKARAEVQLANRQEIDKLQESLRLGQARVGTLTAQLQSAGKLEVLAPDQVGAVMNDFLRQVQGGIPSLRLAEGELKLKLGLARSGETQGFVILQPGSQTDAQAPVHEVALKFDRSGVMNLPDAKV